MYIPPHYASSNPRRIIDDYPFATLITTDANGLHATTTPIFFETDDEQEHRLIGHLAGRNVQATGLAPDQSALVVFAGPHAYISGAWYSEKPQVPTWNYVQAQVKGLLTPIDDRETSLFVLERTAQKLSHGDSDDWHLVDAPDKRVDTLLPYIRSFRILIDEIVGAEKLSQTHPVTDQRLVVEQLQRRGLLGDREIADRMQNRIAGAAT